MLHGSERDENPTLDERYGDSAVSTGGYDDADFDWRNSEQSRDEEDLNAVIDAEQAERAMRQDATAPHRYPFIVELTDAQLCEVIAHPYKVPGVLVKAFLDEAVPAMMKRLRQQIAEGRAKRAG